MLLDLAHLGAELVDLFRDTFEVLVLLVECIEASVDLPEFVMKGFELFADHSGNFFADHLTRNFPHIIFRQHAIFDEVDGLKDIFGVLVHRSAV